MSVTTTQQRGRKLRRTPKLIASAAALSMLAVPLTPDAGCFGGSCS